MKAFQIEDAKTRYFKSKEDYLQFRQAWKDFHNSDKLRWYEDVDVTFWDAPATQERVFARKKFTALNSSSYMLYNLLRGYDIARGYSEHSEHGWKACDDAASELIQVARKLKDINADSSWSRKWAREQVEKLLAPFGGTVTHQMLYDLAAEMYKSMTEQEFPPFEVEELREIEEPKPEATPKRKLFSWS